MRFFTAVIAVIFSLHLNAQVQLLPCLTNGQMPSDADSIQQYTPYIDSAAAFMNGGYQVGQTVNDFILYSRDSIAYQLSNLLTAGNKPVLILCGSYTCPSFRYSVNQILPDIMSVYGPQLIYITIYQLEAHPVGPDYSPFSDTVYTTPQNYAAGILLRQHRTYGDRKYRAYQADSALGTTGITVLDGPGNEYWTAFGPSPNNAYLLTREGWVFNKYGWFANEESQVLSDIGYLLASVGVLQASAPPFISGFSNPVSNETAISSLSGKRISVRIHNTLGQEIYRGELLPGESLRFADAITEDGVYILSLIAEDRQQTFSLVRKQ